MKQTDRRREARLIPEGLRGRVRPGPSLVIVNLSAAGALVESGGQLRPGARIDVHLETDDDRWLVCAVVSRCSVAAIDPRVMYHAALCFTERCDWVRETETQGG